MSSYLPPFARMRQIKQGTPARERAGVPLGRNVEEALIQMASEPVTETIIVVEVPAPVIVLDPTPVVVEPEVVVPKRTKFDPSVKKADLIAIGLAAGLTLDDSMTKNEIIAALQAG